jgi:hypothetical protein
MHGEALLLLLRQNQIDWREGQTFFVLQVFLMGFSIFKIKVGKQIYELQTFKKKT